MKVMATGVQLSQSAKQLVRFVNFKISMHSEYVRVYRAFVC